MHKQTTLKNGLIVSSEDMPRYTSAAALLRNPLPEGYDIYATGKISIGRGGDVVFIDINDKTPTVTMSLDMQQAVAKLGKHVPMMRDGIERKIGENSLISGGTFLRVMDGQDTKLLLTQRSKYKGDNPENGYIDRPLAEHVLVGRMSEPLSRTMSKEAGEEALMFLKITDPNAPFAKSMTEGAAPSSSFNSLTASYTPVLLTFDNRPSVSLDEKKQQIADFLSHTARNIDPVAGDFSYLSARGIPAGKFGQNPVVLEATPYMPDLARAFRIVTRINGKVFDEAHAIPVFDTQGNTAEFYQSRLLELPKGTELAYVTGMEPNPGRPAVMRTDEELRRMPIAARVPWETGEAFGGLVGTIRHMLDCRLWDSQPDNIFCQKIPQMGAVLTPPSSDSITRVGQILTRPASPFRLVA